MSKEYLKDVSPENFERQGDESTPLFLVIQIRSRAVLDYHLRLRNTLCNLNLFVHDHRMWYPKVRNTTLFRSLIPFSFFIIFTILALNEKMLFLLIPQCMCIKI